MYGGTYKYIYMLCDRKAFTSPESCSKVLIKYSWQTAPYTSATIATISQGHGFFFVFHLELTPFSDGHPSKLSVRPTVFIWENIEREICTAVVRTTRRRRNFFLFALDVVVDVQR